jgi:hypothetical protein
MPQFRLGQRVTVLHGDPHGLGTIHDVYGGPTDAAYRVLMDQRGEDGCRVMAEAYDTGLVAADPIEPYTLGQRVTYLGRAATITDLVPPTDAEDPRDAVLEVACDLDPPELFSGVEHHYTFVMPAWKLYAYAR